MAVTKEDKGIGGLRGGGEEVTGGGGRTTPDGTEGGWPERDVVNLRRDEFTVYEHKLEREREREKL